MRTKHNKMIDDAGLLKNAWYVAGLSEDIKSGKPVASIILEVPLVLWRTDTGSVKAILDRCNHRNAPLSKGHVKENCLVCPYHGWVYNGEGRCTTIPSEGPHTERIPNKKVEKFEVFEINGLVWVWMGRDIEPEGQPFNVGKMPGNGWKGYYMVTKFNNDVTDLVENFMDVPHTAFVHKGWFRNANQLCIKATVERTADSVLVTYLQENDSIGFSRWLLNPKGLPLKHTDNFYMPNNTQVEYIFGEYDKAFVITSTCTPVRPFETIVYTHIAYKFGWLNLLSKLFLPFYTRKVIEQDVWIMDVHGDNLKMFGEKAYKSTQADALHVYIESLRKWAMHNGEIPRPAPIVKEIEFWI